MFQVVKATVTRYINVTIHCPAKIDQSLRAGSFDRHRRRSQESRRQTQPAREQLDCIDVKFRQSIGGMAVNFLNQPEHDVEMWGLGIRELNRSEVLATPIVIADQKDLIYQSAGLVVVDRRC